MAKPRYRKKKRKTNLLGPPIYVGVAALLLLALSYFVVFSSNIRIRSGSYYLYIPEHAQSETVYTSLVQQNLLHHQVSLWLMMEMYALQPPRKGLYKIKKGWGNFMLIYELNHQKARPYHAYTVPPWRLRSAVIEKVCSEAGVSPEKFKQLLEDSVYLSKLGNFTRESIYCLFIPGQYKIPKRSNEQELMESLHAEYCWFWNDERVEEAKQMGYTPEDLTILASIVYAETKNLEEMPLIAGLYLNRLKKNMRLEADPTLIYATGSHQARRVYRKYTAHPSKYNTYRNKGLPPGPIGPTPVFALEATLHPAEHDYLFFCANENLSGCHIFSQTFESHKKNAERYRKALDRNKIH